MVEGPGATRNGRKIIRALNHRVIDAEFQLGSKTMDTSAFIGRYLTDSFVVGKEVFLIFANSVSGRHEADSDVGDNEDLSEITVRLHFGMNGCIYTGGSSGVTLPQWRRDEVPSLRLLFGIRSNEVEIKKNSGQTQLSNKHSSQIVENHISMAFEARRTTISLIPTSIARLKLSRLASYDVCSQKFNANHVYERLLCLARTNKDLIISDAILDQGTFPGVGNIIKIEGLHKAKVHPRRTVASLKDVDIRRVVAFCRQYSIQWLKNGRSPTKLVYNQTICGTCKNTSVSICKLGGENSSSQAALNGRYYMSRTTFWCTFCQPISESSVETNSNKTVDPNYGIDITGFEQQRLRDMNSVYCPQHGHAQVIIRRVRKPESANFSRLFYTCRRKDCQFFSWADGDFPLCFCGKKAALKVSKTARSGGRWFFSCARGNGMGDGCKLFEWAEQTQLNRIGSLLTPLL